MKNRVTRTDFYLRRIVRTNLRELHLGTSPGDEKSGCVKYSIQSKANSQRFSLEHTL